MAAVFCASFRRRAMVWRRRVILTRSSRAASSAGTGWRGSAGCGAGVGAAACEAPETARATSSFMMRPSRPVPCTASGERPASAIAFLAEGASSTSFFGAGSCAGAASVFFGVSAFGAAATPCPSDEISASFEPAATVVPSVTRISASTPAAGAGTSTETLSVSSSQSISSCATVSPGFLNQVDTVASDTDSPRAGTITSIILLSPAPAFASAPA